MTDDLTRDGRRVVEDWLANQAELEAARRVVMQRETDVASAAVAVAKWLLPDDAKPGEKIAVWYLDSLIQAEVMPHGTPPKITLRTRGPKTPAQRSQR